MSTTEAWKTIVQKIKANALDITTLTNEEEKQFSVCILYVDNQLGQLAGENVRLLQELDALHEKGATASIEMEPTLQRTRARTEAAAEQKKALEANERLRQQAEKRHVDEVQAIRASLAKAELDRDEQVKQLRLRMDAIAKERDDEQERRLRAETVRLPEQLTPSIGIADPRDECQKSFLTLQSSRMAITLRTAAGNVRSRIK